MSELANIVGNVQAVNANLSQTRQAALVWQKHLAQDISYIIDQVGSTNQTDIKDCLAALRNAINSLQKMQEALTHSITIANSWIEKHSGSIYSTPVSNYVVNPTPYEADDETYETAAPRVLTADEVNERWKTLVETSDDIIDNYRDALVLRGIPDSKLLDKFLQVQKNKMLEYEAGVLNHASGHGEMSEADNYIYPIAGAEGEYGYDSLANEYGSFCLQDTSGWINNINPNFYNPHILPDKNPYHINCGSCAFAVDARLSGGDDLVASENNIASDYAMELATGKKCVYMPMEDIESYLQNQGAGSHLIVGINRGPAPNGCPQSGHWFNAFYDGSKFHTIDGQSGEILDWPYDYGDITEWCALI